MLTMDELANKKNVQHNDLITSVAKMDKTPLKMFELAVSCIDPKNPPEDNSVYLSKQDLFSFFSVTDSNRYSRFKEAIETMQKQAYFEVKQETGKGYKYRSIAPIPTIEWNDYDDDVMIRFNVDIMPYLIDLKKNFTQYLINDIIRLNSKYSVVIYKWLSMNYNQYENYKLNGDRTEKQLEVLKNPVIPVNNLREMTDTITTYSRMSNFTTRVLDAPLSEINKNTSFNVEYQKIKKGGRISEIKFFISKKQVAKNEFYKEEQQDPAYLEDKEVKKKEAESLYAEAVESKYTDMLGDFELITFKDFRDKEIMAGLQKSVYPLYDELTQLRGIKGVEKHISYVASRKEDYSKRNIVRYLYEAISNYIPRVKLENNPESFFNNF